MNHFGPEIWSAYVRSELTEAERAAAEEHLYECDVCLELYRHCVEQASGFMPALEDADSFVDRVMRSVELEPAPQAAPIERRPSFSRTPCYARPIFQYAVAAVVTLLLMSAGVFREMSSGLEELELKTKAGQEASVSVKLVEKTVALLDRIHSQDFGGIQK